MRVHYYESRLCEPYVCHQGTLVNSPLQGGKCALHVACEMGKLDVVKFLVSKGADVNVSQLRSQELYIVCN